jgi:hypothetical protein
MTFSEADPAFNHPEVLAAKSPKPTPGQKIQSPEEFGYSGWAAGKRYFGLGTKVPGVLGPQVGQVDAPFQDFKHYSLCLDIFSPGDAWVCIAKQIQTMKSTLLLLAKKLTHAEAGVADGGRLPVVVPERFPAAAIRLASGYVSVLLNVAGVRRHCRG